MRNPLLHLAVAFSLLVSGGQWVMAAKIYQWTDEEGVVHFSDVPPDGKMTVEAQEHEFIDYASRESAPDEYSIFNQLDRMSEWRREAAEERMARKELQLEEKRIAEEQHRNRYNNAAPVVPRPTFYPVSAYGYPDFNRSRFSHFNKRRFHSRHHDHRSGHSSGHNRLQKPRHYQLGPGTN